MPSVWGSGEERARRLLGLGVLIGLALACGAPAQAQNLVANGHFHGTIAGWTQVRGTAFLWTDLAEEGECAASGSALVTSELLTGQHIAGIAQCVPFEGGDLFLLVRHQGYGTFRVEMEYFLAPDCSSTLTGTIASESQVPTAWKEFAVPSWAPSNTSSMEIRLYATDSDPHGLSIDEVTLSPRPPIFLDGFEGNDTGEANPCRWGS